MNREEIRVALVEYLRPGEPWPAAPSPEVIADALLPAVEQIARQAAECATSTCRVVEPK